MYQDSVNPSDDPEIRPQRLPRQNIKWYLLAQTVNGILHVLIDLGQVLYGRFAPIDLWLLFLTSVVISLILTHVALVFGGRIREHEKRILRRPNEERGLGKKTR